MNLGADSFTDINTGVDVRWDGGGVCVCDIILLIKMYDRYTSMFLNCSDF